MARSRRSSRSRASRAVVDSDDENDRNDEPEQEDVEGVENNDNNDEEVASSSRGTAESRRNSRGRPAGVRRLSVVDSEDEEAKEADDDEMNEPNENDEEEEAAADGELPQPPSRRNNRAQTNRTSRATSRFSVETGEEKDDDEPQRPTRRSRTSRTSRVQDEEDIAEEEEVEEDSSEQKQTQRCCSQVQDMTQDIVPARNVERMHMSRLTEEKREEALIALSRVVLFKAMTQEPINRLACIEEAGIKNLKIGNAAFEEVQLRLQNVFGFALNRMPGWMERIKDVPTKCKDRYYVMNTILDGDGEHTKAIHAVHQESSIEKAFLMIVLALIYCKGDPRNDGSRWILDKDLYTLLNQLDENIPSEPPAQGSKKKRTGTSTPGSAGRFDGAVAQTPDVDGLIDKFEKHDYIIKVKATEQQVSASQTVEADNFFFTLGTRAAVEIGRRQIIFFCAEVLGEEPDPTMLQEVEADEKLDVEEDGMEEVEA